jgi:hypothetical protein
MQLRGGGDGRSLKDRLPVCLPACLSVCLPACPAALLPFYLPAAARHRCYGCTQLLP